jgi:hypothetical protein
MAIGRFCFVFQWKIFGLGGVTRVGESMTCRIEFLAPNGLDMDS